MADVEPSPQRPTATDRRQHVHVTTDMATGEHLRHLDDPIQRALANQMHLASIGISAGVLNADGTRGADGHVRPETVLAVTGLPGEIAKVLIAEGIWHQDGHDCERCPDPRRDHVYIHDFLEHNHSAENLRLRAERKRRAGAAGAAVRWPVTAQPAEPAGPVEPKRGPGRPRKHPLPELVAATTTDGQIELVPASDIPSEPVKRAPGRPRKHPLPEGQVHPAELRARSRSRTPRGDDDEFPAEVVELCELLASRVRENGYTVPKSLPVGTWLNPCRLLLQRGVPNGTTPMKAEQVRKAILWATDDDFWCKNIRSMSNLRKHYERLRDDAKDGARLKRGALPRGSAQPPAAVTVPNMNSLYGAASAPASDDTDGGLFRAH